MNICILMAEIIKEPELRYTPDNVPLAEMLVEFSVPGMRDDEKAPTLKVVGWRNLATEIKEQYHQGDRVIIEGRLSMSSIDRPEGFKEKRAELTASRIHKLGADTNFGMRTAGAAAEDTNVVSFEPRKPAAAASRKAEVESSYEYESVVSSRQTTFPTQAPAASNPPADKDLDDIPF